MDNVPSGRPVPACSAVFSVGVRWALVLGGLLALLAGLAGGLLAVPASAQEVRAGSFASTPERQGRGGSAVLLDGPACRGGSPAVYCGKVLLAGNGMASELYDPAGDSWSGCPAGDGACGGPLRPGNLSVNVARKGATLTLLDGPACRGTGPPGYCGKVLLVGGTEAPSRLEGADPSPLSRVELYDPAAGRWSSCDSASASAACPAPYAGGAVSGHSATLLSDGRVLVAGGKDDDIASFSQSGRQDFYVYDPATGRWGPSGALSIGRRYHRAVLLEGGVDRCGANCAKVLIVGGEGSGDPQKTAELLDPVSRASVATSNLITPRRVGHSATLLAGGRVLVAGGQASCAEGGLCGNPGDTAEYFDPKAAAAAAWVGAAPLRLRRFSNTATVLASGKVLIAGISFPAEVYDPAAGRSVLTGPAPTAPGTATLLPRGPRSLCGRGCGKVLLTENDSILGWLYTPLPEVTGLAPAGGLPAGGTAVTIEGSGLASVTSVKFGDLEATGVTPDPQSPDTRLVAVSPPHPAGAVAVTATSSGGTSATGPQTQFSYQAPPAAGQSGDGGGASVTAPGTGGGQSASGGGGDSLGPASASERARALALRSCLKAAARRRAGGSSAKARRRQALLRRQARRACLKRYGRTPGRVTGLQARARSKTEIVLSFAAPGSDGSRPPAARGYLVRQSSSPIRTSRDFARAKSLCNGTCSFKVTRVGTEINLTITDLRPRTTYYYAVAARDNVSARLGPRSKTASAKTP